MCNYEEFAKETGQFSTGIHTRLNEQYRISSVYRKYANSHFESWRWETFLWNGLLIERQYGTLYDPEEVLNLHAEVQRNYCEENELI